MTLKKDYENSKMTDRSLFKPKGSGCLAFCGLVLMLVFLVAGCGVSGGDSVKAYNGFGVKCARMGLWNEAIVRWKRVVEIDPNNAQAHNNLGVAYESKGKFDAAMAEYKMAIELDPDSKTYTKNYIKFKRNHERANKRDETQDTKPKAQDSELKADHANSR